MFFRIFSTFSVNICRPSSDIKTPFEGCAANSHNKTRVLYLLSIYPCTYKKLVNFRDTK